MGTAIQRILSNKGLKLMPVLENTAKQGKMTLGKFATNVADAVKDDPGSELIIKLASNVPVEDKSKVEKLLKKAKISNKKVLDAVVAYFTLQAVMQIFNENMEIILLANSAKENHK